MKYNIVFKFLAVLLCAASLLGIVGSGLGIAAMTQGQLYNRTVEEMVEENTRVQGQDLAQTLASRYASTALGGMPEGMVSERFPVHFYGLLNGKYHYAIKDQDGEVLYGSVEDAPEGSRIHAFPVRGQYLHLVSSQTEQERHPAEPEVSVNTVSTDELYLMEAIPPEGAAITQMYISFADGQTFDYADDQGVGSVNYTRDGYISCIFTEYYAVLPVNLTVTDLVLISGGQPVYEAHCEAGVGYVKASSTGIGQTFVSTIAPEQIPAETVEETVSETTVEIVPETIAATVPETTVPETEPFVPAKVTDNIAQDGIAEVSILEAKFSDGRELSHRDEFGLGRVRHEGNKIVFSSYENWKAETGVVIRIRLLKDNGDVLYEASHQDGIGQIFYHEDAVRFESDIPEPPVVETVPVTVPPTVPETTAATVPETTEIPVPETEPAFTRPAFINGTPLDEYDIMTGEYYDHQLGQRVYVEYVYTPMPEYTVELYLTEDSYLYSEGYEVLKLVRHYRAYLLPVLLSCILLFFAFGTYLTCAAGRKPGRDGRQAGGLNRIPLDLYLVIVGLGIPSLCVILPDGTDYLLRRDLVLGCSYAVGIAFAGCLLTVGFLFALVAQIKTPGGFWLHNTMVVRFLRCGYRMILWMERKGRESLIPFAVNLLMKIWNLWSKLLVWLYRTTEKGFLWTGNRLGRFFLWLKDVLHRFLSLLPVTWQWLVCGFLMILTIALVFATNMEEILMVLCFGFCIFLVVYGAHCFGTLLDSTKKMRKGDLDTKVDDKMMVGAFKEFAGELNELAGVAVVAAQKQLNSERMKSELITNVSHDIKTPLTSIINYADLLQKPHTEEEQQQYLEVLSRQSLQLKKLLEDLMDMSKASTGNMNVEITQLDAVEAVNQALGEYADKLERAGLTPVFRYTEPFVPMMADGRLVWRVLGNLLGNAVKYAMPGTRVYLDLMQLEGSVVLSMKNISREELNIDADELMERFVRGDDARNTEGSGLGLNIAKSLMELQKGQMQILVDGDLFKVTLIFPAE